MKGLGAVLLVALALLAAAPATARAICGDGVLEDGEGCDDGGREAGDGCDADCAVELGFACDEGVRLGRITAEDYPGSSPPASWDVAADGLSAVQTVNGNASVGLFGADAMARTWVFDVTVETTDDDDWFGFVLGFAPGDTTNDAADFLLLDWKQATQAGWSAGLVLSRVRGVPDQSTGAPGTDLWNHNGAVSVIARADGLGDVGWVDLRTYRFEIAYTPSRLVVRVDGAVEIDLSEGRTEVVRIERLHLEQDAGKSLHDQHPSMSYVDLNRSGIALMEIVSYPDLRSPEEAQAYLRKLRAILRYLGTCDGNMEQGSMRADVNVSVRRVGEGLGTRCEIKNVNSIRFVGLAIDYEARRQIEILEGGGTIDQETRLFDPRSGETRSMRSKEEAHDYRYFPDPDLLPLEFQQAWVDEIAGSLPELPDDKKARFIADYGLTPYDASVLVGERARADFFEEVAEGRDPKLAVNWINGDFFAALNKAGLDIEESPVSANQLGALVDLIADDTISGRIAKDVFQIMFETGRDPNEIVETEGLKQVTDTSAIEAAIDEVIAANPDKVEQVKEKPKMAGWFVGQVMKATGGKANPQMVNELLAKKLGLEDA